MCFGEARSVFFAAIFIGASCICTSYGVSKEPTKSEAIISKGTNKSEVKPMKSLIIVYSYHHGNTAKLANAFGNVLGSVIKKPQEVNPQELLENRLIGFGSGIYSAKHHKSLFELVDKLPQGDGKIVFIFSTFGAPAAILDKKESDKLIAGNHARLRQKLLAKGYDVVGDFGCPGFNTNSFLKFFGGLNKGRPNSKDLRQAEEFAENLKRFANE